MQIYRPKMDSSVCVTYKLKSFTGHEKCGDKANCWKGIFGIFYQKLPL